MRKKEIEKVVSPGFTIAFLLCALTMQAKEKAHIVVKATADARPTELVIEKSGVDPRQSKLRTSLGQDIYECDIETDAIDIYSIFDWGEIMEKGYTSMSQNFLVEDGALITLTYDGKKISVESTGKEQQAVNKMNDQQQKLFGSKLEALDSIKETDKNLYWKRSEELYNEIRDWRHEYYIQNPMINYLLEFDVTLSQPRFNFHYILYELDLYHKYYADKYPGHPAHANIARNENRGFQLFGGKYHDYKARTLDGTEVNASDYMKPGYNMVILWATWCGPCRRECQEIASFIEPYINAGLNVWAVTREFANTDAVKKAVEEDKYPWLTLVDLDDEYHLFDKHGATSSATFLIDPDGKIIYSEIDLDELKKALADAFPHVKPL